MKPSIKFKTTILPLLTRLHRYAKHCGQVLLALGFFALPHSVQAVGPDTEGAIPGANNGEGIGVLVSRTSGVWNTGTGFEALNHLTAGNQNTATGLRALSSDTNGGFNTATGVLSLFSNTSGFFNSATGAYALANNTTGNSNTANGYGALYFNTADANTATGFGALFKNTTGEANTANGYLALNRNTTGFTNTATGERALFSNIDGFSNVAVGIYALYSNTSGSYNNAHGAYALENNIDGFENEAFGDVALNSVTHGSQNVAIGDEAGISITTGSGNTLIGKAAGLIVTGDGNVCLGADVIGVAGVDNTTWIRNVYESVATGRIVYVNSDGKVGTLASSRRFKEGIKPMNEASEAILGLKPVTFRYKKEIDSNRAPQFGLVAEDVAKVDPDLVVRDKNGQVYSVRYEAVNAMLLNEFLKEHRKVEEQQASITQLKSTVENQDTTIAQQQKEFQSAVARQRKEMDAVVGQLKEQAAQIQKVNARLDANRPARQMVNNR
jgi:hypothetical protein